jgi:23S rRNA (uracil1939-C5)-methyltransferase
MPPGVSSVGGDAAVLPEDAVFSCPHLPPCPGCPRFGDAGPPARALETLGDVCARHGIRPEVRTGPRRRFRLRARLAVRGRVGSPKIGIFAEGTHRVVDIPRCEIHHELINDVAGALKGCMRELAVSSYSDGAHAGLVRGVQVVIERPSQTAQIVLVCNASEPTSAKPLLDRLAERLGPRLHSLWWNGNPEVNNRVLGPLYDRRLGPAHVVEHIGGADVFFPPGAFGQNNLDLFDCMVEQLHAWVPDGSHVVELYSGTGSIGLGLLRRAERVVFNELGEASLAGLASGLEHLPEDQRQRARVVAGPAQRAVPEIRRDSLVIVDPPRKGLDPEVLAALAAHPPRRLLYVSCGLSSFVRDAELLAVQGLRLEALTAYDLFPYTEHVESLASFTRPSAA